MKAFITMTCALFSFISFFFNLIARWNSWNWARWTLFTSMLSREYFEGNIRIYIYCWIRLELLVVFLGFGTIIVVLCYNTERDASHWGPVRCQILCSGEMEQCRHSTYKVWTWSFFVYVRYLHWFSAFRKFLVNARYFCTWGCEDLITGNGKWID